MRDLRRCLIVPAFITATSIAPACGDSKPPSTGTDPASETDAASTDTPTTSGATDTDDSTGGALPDCDMLVDMSACAATVGCLWDDLGGVCVTDCEKIHDEATCAMADYCEWFDGACYPPI